jgi:hypothetical protein
VDRFNVDVPAAAGAIPAFTIGYWLSAIVKFRRSLKRLRIDIRPRGVEVWLPLIFPLVMSSADLNNGSPDFRHPEKADSVDELTRVYGGIAPRIFFNQLVQDFRPIHSLQSELERASFLYRRMRVYRFWLWFWSAISILVPTLPLLCLISPADLGLAWFVCAICAEGPTVFVLWRVHHKWIYCRRDYTRWLRLVHRRVAEEDG